MGIPDSPRCGYDSRTQRITRARDGTEPPRYVMQFMQGGDKPAECKGFRERDPSRAAEWALGRDTTMLQRLGDDAQQFGFQTLHRGSLAAHRFRPIRGPGDDYSITVSYPLITVESMVTSDSRFSIYETRAESPTDPKQPFTYTYQVIDESISDFQTPPSEYKWLVPGEVKLRPVQGEQPEPTSFRTLEEAIREVRKKMRKAANLL